MNDTPTKFEIEVESYGVDCVRMIARMTPTEREKLLLFLLMKRRVDGLNGRDWDASLHLQNEDIVVKTMKPYGVA